MKIVSYNINGIRSVMNKGFSNWIKIFQPDILCLQEIKAIKKQIHTTIFDNLGYNHYWFSAKKKGYSGVAILCKEKPINIEYGIGVDSIDQEGRVIRIDFKKMSVISLYIPSGNNPKKNRLNFKFFFMKHFFLYIKKIKKKLKNIIICGDYNICHKNIDIYNPIKNREISGFLPKERQWLSDFLKLGFIDSFRIYIKDGKNYSWWNYRYNSKKNNHGWRIDYAMISKYLKNKMIKAYLLPKIVYSDHCPMVLEIEKMT